MVTFICIYKNKLNSKGGGKLTSYPGSNFWHIEPGNTVPQWDLKGVWLFKLRWEWERACYSCIRWDQSKCMFYHMLSLGRPIDSEFGHKVYMQKLFLRCVFSDFPLSKMRTHFEFPNVGGRF